jgi:hypothetical protein
MSSDTYIVRIPSADVPRALKPEVHRPVLGRLPPHDWIPLTKLALSTHSRYPRAFAMRNGKQAFDRPE